MTQHESVFNDVETREVNKVAALDIGSNSFHLVVARIVAGSVQILHRVKQKVSDGAWACYAKSSSREPERF